MPPSGVGPGPAAYGRARVCRASVDEVQPVVEEELHAADQEADAAHDREPECRPEADHDHPDAYLRSGAEEQALVRLREEEVDEGGEGSEHDHNGAQGYIPGGVGLEDRYDRGLDLPEDVGLHVI